MKNLIITKIGGGEGINYEAICDDVAELAGAGQPLILVHGGSAATNEVASALGHSPRFITSPSGYTSRLTDRRTLEIFEMVYCGRINKDLVERLQRRKINAVGLSGIDGGLWSGPRKEAITAIENGRRRIIRDTFTGKVELVNTQLLQLLLDNRYMPVLTPPAISSSGEAINVDGDRAAAATAVAMNASELIILSNVPGVLADFPDEATLISHIAGSDLAEVSANMALGRMRIKLLAAAEALSGGVRRVVLGDARYERPLSRALRGAGTTISGEGMVL